LAHGPKDLVVDSGGLELAARDFGGSGPAIILLHGLGRSLIDWQLIAPLLSVDCHVVAFDLRCHGHSDDGEWSWGNALADLTAVADHLHRANPAIAGHSLGGMLAVMWGESHPNYPGVVNLEGHETRIRPALGGIGSEILAQAEAFDMLDLYSRVQCPVLIVNGMAAELGAGPAWIKELMAAYRKGIERDLAALAGRQRNVRAVNLAASHALVFEQPPAIAREILTFLR
jgi:pimeloyl-ACP methyl ester carboxylesterase